MQIKIKEFTYQPLKNGIKLIFIADKETKKKISPHLYEFEDKPLDLDINIDAGERLKQINRISPEMRNKAYAILGDINKKNGQGVESIKFELKKIFLTGFKQYDTFSLADCSKELATDFITFLISWCYKNEIELEETPLNYVDDIESYLYVCLREKKCCICGKPGEEHHWDAIGMGRDRRHYDDSEHRKIELCREHHNEVEQIGRDTFAEKYHVEGILFKQ